MPSLRGAARGGGRTGRGARQEPARHRGRGKIEFELPPPTRGPVARRLRGAKEPRAKWHIPCGEEGEDVRQEVALVVTEALPVLVVVGQIQLLGGPEGRLSLLVHLPHLVVLDGEDDEAPLVLAQHGLDEFFVVGAVLLDLFLALERALAPGVRNGSHVQLSRRAAAGSSGSRVRREKSERATPAPNPKSVPFRASAPTEHSTVSSLTELPSRCALPAPHARPRTLSAAPRPTAWARAGAERHGLTLRVPARPRHLLAPLSLPQHRLHLRLAYEGKEHLQVRWDPTPVGPHGLHQ